MLSSLNVGGSKIAGETKNTYDLLLLMSVLVVAVSLLVLCSDLSSAIQRKKNRPRRLRSCCKLSVGVAAGVVAAAAVLVV